jgi:hypothetical protein
MKVHEISHTFGLDPAEPLWKRAPTRDAYGNPLSDFMMIIPKLRSRPHHVLQDIIKEIQGVLSFYSNVVVFADLNLKLNLLWVTVKPVPGICLELPTAIKLRVPDALLVGQRIDS